MKVSNQSSITRMQTEIATVGQVRGDLSRGRENYPLGASLCIVDKTFRNIKSPHVREYGLRNPRNFGWWNPEARKKEFVKSGILGFGIRNTAQGIRNPSNDCNPESKFHWNPGPKNPKSTACNPQSWGELNYETY